MPINVDDGIFAALREAGSSDSQIEDAKLVLGPLCQMQGHICILTATGAALESGNHAVLTLIVFAAF